MCVSLCLANIGAKWSIWNWILSNAFLTLVSGLYVLYSHFPVSAWRFTAWKAICLGCWLAQQCTRCVFAGWQLASHLKSYLFCKEPQKVVVTVSLERKAGSRHVCTVLSLCGCARTQKWADTYTVRRRDTAMDYSWLSFGRRERILGG